MRSGAHGLPDDPFSGAVLVSGLYRKKGVPFDS